MKKLSLLSALIAPVLSVTAQTKEPDARMLQNPDIHGDEIVFVYAEDVWSVSSKGGVAHRLTSAMGNERNPKFSPDGSKIAFTANYDGNYDLYTMATEGGEPKRLTYHSAYDKLMDWTPDGKELLFGSRRFSPLTRYNQFYTVSTEGGMPEQLPLQYIELGDLNDDGSLLVYQYIDRTTRNWKRYQGGMASDLWVYDFEAQKSTQLTKYIGSDDYGMWHGNTIYFLSDRGSEGIINVWKTEFGSNDFKQVTFFKEFDVKTPSKGKDHMIFQNGGHLFKMKFENGKVEKIDVQIPFENLAVRPQMKDLSKRFNEASISHKGERITVGSRGELISIPTEEGVQYNLTNTSGIRERGAQYSPDGKYLAYFSDEEGEYNVYIKPLKESGEAIKLTNTKGGYLSNILWSPNSELIAYENNWGGIFIVDIKSKSVDQLDKLDWSLYGDKSWSPDSKWLAYSNGTNMMKTNLKLYSLKEKKATTITSGYYSDGSPSFDTEGEYLFYVSRRKISPEYSAFEGSWIYTDADVIVAVPLQQDTKPYITDKNQDDAVSINDDSEKDEDEDEGDEDSDEVTIEIDLENFESRGQIINYKEDQIIGMQTHNGGLYYSVIKDWMIELKKFDKEEKSGSTIISGISGYEFAPDADKLLYFMGGNGIGVVDLAPGQKAGDGLVPFKNYKVEVDIQAEWRQIFTEAWRMERDFFYDPDMHGVDWDKMKDRYLPLIDDCASRADVNYVIGQLLGELNVGHAYVYGGEMTYPEYESVGMLGVNFTINPGDKYYKIEDEISAGVWDLNVKSAFDAAGIKDVAGKYLIAVNHQPVDPMQSPYKAFQNLANKQIMLTINDKPSMEGAEEVMVTTMYSESRLRYYSWIEEMRQRVYDASNGQIGYIYVPNTGIDGQNNLVRQFYGQYDMASLIVDERWNGGGQIPDRFIELLNRPSLNYFTRRDGAPMTVPFVHNAGPKVMLANEWSGSGGDAFPYYFKQAQVGPVVGKRTWGGLVGITGMPSLMDGGSVSVPAFAFVGNDGQWGVEGYGVDPDYDVTNTSDEVYRGIDHQLEKAIQLMLEALKEHPKQDLVTPAYPNKTGMGNQ